MLYTLFRLNHEHSGCSPVMQGHPTQRLGMPRQLQVYLVDQKADKQAAFKKKKRLTTGGYALK